jgi:hypothetical protein
MRRQLHNGNIMVHLGTHMSKTIVLASLLFGACSVGEVSTNQQVPLDGPNGVVVDAPVGINCATRATPATPAHKHTNGGTSNQGQGCVEAGCHNIQTLGTNAPGFQYAGTVMQLSAQTLGNAGITVTFVTDSGMTVSTTTDTDGNFYYPAPLGNATGTLIPNPFPMSANVDVCPNTHTSPMVNKIVTGQGDCNAGGTCHGVGGSTGAILLDPGI